MAGYRYAAYRSLRLNHVDPKTSVRRLGKGGNASAIFCGLYGNSFALRHKVQIAPGRNPQNSGAIEEEARDLTQLFLIGHRFAPAIIVEAIELVAD
jgi:hypothetical protein